MEVKLIKGLHGSNLNLPQNINLFTMGRFGMEVYVDKMKILAQPVARQETTEFTIDIGNLPLGSCQQLSIH